MARFVGFLSELQVRVLVLKRLGLSYRKIASKLRISHGSVAAAYKKALANISRAKKTIMFYEILSAARRVVVQPGVKLVEIPKIVLEEADAAGVKVEADFTLIYKLIRYRASSCVSERVVVKPILVLVSSDGSLSVYPFEEVAQIVEVLDEMTRGVERGATGITPKPSFAE